MNSNTPLSSHFSQDALSSSGGSCVLLHDTWGSNCLHEVTIMSSVLHFFSEYVCHVSFPIDVSYHDVSFLLIQSNAQILHVNMPEFPGQRATLTPIHTSSVIIPDCCGSKAIGHIQILQQMPDRNDRLGTFICSIYFGFTRTPTDLIAFSMASPYYRASLSKYNVAKEGLDFFLCYCLIRFRMAGILWTPVGITIYAVRNRETRYAVQFTV